MSQQEQAILNTRIERAIREVRDLAEALGSGPATFRNIDNVEGTLKRRAEKVLS